MQSPNPSSLVETYSEYAKAIALKAARDLPIESEDAIAAANLGLAEAARRFSLERCHQGMRDGLGSLDTNFRSFSYLRIWGAVHDEARRNSFTRRRGLEKGIKFQMVSMDNQNIDADGYATPSLEIPVYEDVGAAIDLLDSIDYLDDRERAVIIGLASGFSGQEIATRLSLTPSRVSQIGKRAKAKMLDHIS